MNKFRFIAEEELEKIVLKREVTWTGDNWPELLRLIQDVDKLKNYAVKPDQTIIIRCIESYSFKTNDLIEREYTMNLGDTFAIVNGEMVIRRAELSQRVFQRARRHDGLLPD